MKPNEAQTAVVKILYFARLREVLGRAEEELVIPDGVSTIGELTVFLRARGDDWSTELAIGKAVRIAVNQDIAEADTPISGGQEIAFFPPVTGG
jgi:molybdopterin synthase sulfur carrier subunit